MQLQAEDVSVESVLSHGTRVYTFLETLFAAGSVQAPTLNSLVLPHPSDGPAYARMLRRDVGFPHVGSSADADTEGSKRGQQALQERWLNACQRLHSLPSTGKFAKSARDLQHPVVPPASLDESAEWAAAGMGDVVVQISVHSPKDSYARTQVILASSSHTLEELRDSIECVNDRYAAQQLGSAPRGGLFFIGGALFEDRRGRGTTVDYTGPVLAFLRRQASAAEASARAHLQRCGLADTGVVVPLPDTPDVRPMDGTLVEELTVQPCRAGIYVYVHAGACEHMLVVEDVRLRHGVDDPPRAVAPAILWQQPPRLEKCCICLARPSTRVAFDDARAPCSPAFFCGPCFDALHRGRDGRLLPDVEGADIYDVHV